MAGDPGTQQRKNPAQEIPGAWTCSVQETLMSKKGSHRHWMAQERLLYTCEGLRVKCELSAPAGNALQGPLELQAALVHDFNTPQS